jgi:hypothetical protein
VKCRWVYVKAVGPIDEDLDEIEELIAPWHRSKVDTFVMVEVVGSFVSVIKATLILGVLML